MISVPELYISLQLILIVVLTNCVAWKCSASRLLLQQNVTLSNKNQLAVKIKTASYTYHSSIILAQKLDQRAIQTSCQQTGSVETSIKVYIYIYIHVQGVYMGSGYASWSSGTTKQLAQLFSSCLTFIVELEAFQINITKSLPNAITCFLDDTAYSRFFNSTQM